MINSQSAYDALQSIILEEKGDQTPQNPLEVIDKPNVLVEFKEGEERKLPASQEQIDDFVFVRKTLRELIMQGQDILVPAIKEAKANSHPRQIDAANQTMKAISDISGQLIELHDRLNRIQKNSEQEKPKAETKQVIVVRSTLDLFDDEGEIK